MSRKASEMARHAQTKFRLNWIGFCSIYYSSSNLMPAIGVNPCISMKCTSSRQNSYYYSSSQQDQSNQNQISYHFVSRYILKTSTPSTHHAPSLQVEHTQFKSEYQKHINHRERTLTLQNNSPKTNSRVYQTQQILVQQLTKKKTIKKTRMIRYQSICTQKRS